MKNFLGLYPHRLDCNKFIICSNKNLNVYECPQSSLFNPISRICDVADAVNCETSCANRADGYYPHPHDCALYLICRSEVGTIFKCPTPLLFDPKRSVCYLPDAVNCKASDGM